MSYVTLCPEHNKDELSTRKELSGSVHIVIASAKLLLQKKKDGIRSGFYSVYI